MGKSTCKWFFFDQGYHDMLNMPGVLDALQTKGQQAADTAAAMSESGDATYLVIARQGSGFKKRASCLVVGADYQTMASNQKHNALARALGSITE